MMIIGILVLLSIIHVGTTRRGRMDVWRVHFAFVDVFFDVGCFGFVCVCVCVWF